MAKHPNKPKEKSSNHPSGTYVQPWSEVIGDSKQRLRGGFDGYGNNQVE